MYLPVERYNQSSRERLAHEAEVYRLMAELRSGQNSRRDRLISDMGDKLIQLGLKLKQISGEPVEYNRQPVYNEG